MLRNLFTFRGRSMRGVEIAIGITVTLLLVGFWEFASSSGFANRQFLPPPSAVVAASWNMLKNQNLLWHAAVSTFRVWLAFLIAAVMAIPIGILMSSYRIIGAAF